MTDPFEKVTKVLTERWEKRQNPITPTLAELTAVAHELNDLLAKEEAAICEAIAEKLKDSSTTRIPLKEIAPLSGFFGVRRTYDTIDVLRKWVFRNFHHNLRVEGDADYTGFAFMVVF